MTNTASPARGIPLPSSPAALDPVGPSCRRGRCPQPGDQSRRVDYDCLQELRWLYDRRDLPEARRDLAAWLAKWSGKYSKLTGWVEENIDATLTFYRLPRQHHKHVKSN